MTPEKWKNKALSQALYEEALKPLTGPFGEAIPPATPEQRLQWQLENYAYRLRRAADILLGQDDEES